MHLKNTFADVKLVGEGLYKKMKSMRIKKVRDLKYGK